MKTNRRKLKLEFTTHWVLRKVRGLLIVVTALIVFAQTQHVATLNWTDTINPPGTLYNAYRATGPCSPTAAFVKIGSMIGSLSFQDTTITPGTFCYAVTAVSPAGESGQSNTAQATLAPPPPLPAPPTGLTVVVK